MKNMFELIRNLISNFIHFNIICSDSSESFVITDNLKQIEYQSNHKQHYSSNQDLETKSPIFICYPF